jgi:hypothetical protein
MTEIKYFFVLGSEKFLLKQEPMEEILRERVQNYNKKNKPLNFWIVPNPAFLKADDFSMVKDKISGDCIAIVSTDKTFITWLKLRLNNVFSGNFKFSKQTQISPLKF